MKKFKADTVEQFIIYQWICEHFDINYVMIKKVDRYSLSLIDSNNDCLLILFNNDFLHLRYYMDNTYKEEILSWNQTKLCVKKK